MEKFPVLLKKSTLKVQFFPSTEEQQQASSLETTGTARKALRWVNKTAMNSFGFHLQ